MMPAIHHVKCPSLVVWVILLLALPADTIGDGRQVSYVGCMKRTSTGSFRKRVDGANDTRTMSVQRCVDMCWYRRMKLAGIQAEHQCFCSFTTTGLSTVPEKACRSRCTANCYQACGGPNALSVYKTGYTREPTFVIQRKAFLPAYIGCYDSQSSADILCPREFRPLWTKRLTIPMCIYYCDAVYQTKYSTVSATDKCCCSNSVRKAKRRRKHWCDKLGKPCDGDKNQGCIGTQRKTLQWSTHQRDRLPNFKRWPKATFTRGKWLKPNFKAGDKYLMSDLAQPVELAAGDATLMGLLARKNARKKIEEETTDESDDEKRPLVGADKRDPSVTDTKAQAGIVDVPKKTAVPSSPDENSNSNTPIVIAVVVGFLVLLSAIGFYLYRQNKAKEEAGEKIEGDSRTEDETEDDTDEDDDESRMVRRRKRKKPKKRKSEKRRSRKSRDEDEDSDTDQELEQDRLTGQTSDSS